MRLDTLAKRIGFGYTIILLLFAIATGVTFFQMKKIENTSSRIKNLRGPTALASSMLLNGINHSQEALRGWILIGKNSHENFRDDRKSAWNNQIKTSLRKIKKLSHLWTNPENIKRLDRIEGNLISLEQFQEEIENIAHTPNNKIASKILTEEAGPNGTILLEKVTLMIEIEKNRKSGPERKKVFGLLADLKGTTGLSIDNMRAYILSGDERFKENFTRAWRKNEIQLNELSLRKKSLNPKQLRAYEIFFSTREAFKSLPKKMFKIRSSLKWNLANFWLQTKAAPIAWEIKENLSKMVKDQQDLMEKDFSINNEQIHRLKFFTISLLLICIFLTILISYKSVKSIIGPIMEVLKIIQSIANGDYGQKLTSSNIKEVNFLGEATLRMQKNLVDLKNGLEDEQSRLLEEDWIKTTFAKIMEKLQGHKDLQHFSNELITHLVSNVKGQVGVFYAKDNISKNFSDNDGDEQVTLSLLASYAYTKRKHNSNHIQLGEGLIGQCALEQKTICLTNIPDDYIVVSSGIMEVNPTNIIVTPLLFENSLLGVLEVGSIGPFTKSQRIVLEQVAANVGVIINSMLGSIRTQDLLFKSERMGQSLKEQQEELRATNEELEEKSEHLEKQKNDIEAKKNEIELTKKKVELKAEELELASKYKSEFLSNMSHELRTPLNSLLILSKSFADNEEGNLTEDQIEEAGIIYSGGKDLLTLINDILDLSKVEAGQMEVNIEDEKVSSIMSSLKNMFSPISKDKNIEFEVIDSSNSQNLETDRMRCEQVLKNFLSNAFKFSDGGKVTLESYSPVEGLELAHKDLSPSEVIAFSVTDAGVGIPKDKQAQIFEAFQQQDGSTARKYGGTGLGLTISRQLSKLLGGEIHLESEEGKGSTFTLFLPIKSCGEITTSNIKLNEKKEGPTNANEKIANFSQNTLLSSSISNFIPDDRKGVDEKDRVLLVIEDDKNFATILYNLAKKRGYKCLVAGDGKSGLKLALDFLPQGIILDIGLPLLDGLSVLDQLKFDVKTRHIPIHMLSGKDESKISLDKGAKSFVNKPANSEDLDKIFEQLKSASGNAIKSVLVVEDDKDNQMMIGNLIKKEGIDIVFAETGEEALLKLSEAIFDCMVLDYNFSDMTCLDLLRKLKERNYPNLSSTVIHTERELSKDEYSELNSYTDRIVIKGDNASERLLDEVLLFLHSVGKSRPLKEKRIVQIQNSFDQVFQGKKILLVDDDMRNIYALSKVIKKTGLEVRVAENGQVALDRLQEEEGGLDLIVMDIMMPIMDGLEAMEKIREMKEFQDLPIIALTAKTMTSDRDRSFSAGASDFLNKPIDAEKLISLIRVWLSGADNKKYQLKSA